MRWFWIALYGLSAAGLALYGLNSLYLAIRFLKGRRVRHEHPDEAAGFLPSVTVQLPLYNEMNVVERLLGGVLSLDYPGDRLVVQVLDDSTDGTSALVGETFSKDARLRAVTGVPALRTGERRRPTAVGTGDPAPEDAGRVREWVRRDGVVVQHVRRGDRTGFKAGALAYGMRVSVTDAYAVFDADFLPAPDFLLRTVPHLADPEVGFVQARWGHLNRERSLLTRAQALAIDAHFAVEQQARSSSGFFFNFNGTAGVWRRRAIEAVGGWQARTLTEDLDLSYRAQLAGWRGVFAGDVVVPGEIPRDLNALKNQQFRWAKGSLQTGRLLAGAVLRADVSKLVKLQAVVHLFAYLVHPLLLGLLLSTAFLIRDFPMVLVVFGVTAVTGLSPPFVVAVGQWSLHRDWARRLVLIPFLTALGMGIAVVNTRAALEAFLRVSSGFVRTPKEGSGRRRADYRALVGVAPLFEVGAAAMAVWTLGGAVDAGRYTAVPFLTLYVAAFGYVFLASLASAFRSALGVARTE